MKVFCIYRICVRAARLWRGRGSVAGVRGVGEVFLLERVQTCFLCGLRPLLVDTLSRRRPLSLAGARLQVCTHQRIAKQQRFGLQIAYIARRVHFALQNKRRLHNHLCTVLFSTFHYLAPRRRQKYPLLHTCFYFPPEAEACIFAHPPLPHCTSAERGH